MFYSADVNLNGLFYHKNNIDYNYLFFLKNKILLTYSSIESPKRILKKINDNIIQFEPYELNLKNNTFNFCINNQEGLTEYWGTILNQNEIKLNFRNYIYDCSEFDLIYKKVL